MKINHGFIADEDGNYVITFKLTAPSPGWGALMMALGTMTVFGVVGLGIVAAARIIMEVIS